MCPHMYSSTCGCVLTAGCPCQLAPSKASLAMLLYNAFMEDAYFGASNGEATFGMRKYYFFWFIISCWMRCHIHIVGITHLGVLLTAIKCMQLIVISYEEHKVYFSDE